MGSRRIMAKGAVWWLVSLLLIVAGCGNSNETARLQRAAANDAPSSVSLPLSAGLVWPTTQLLPSFPAPAAVQDLIALRGLWRQWEAESAMLSHNTGRLETDGWLCQPGIDTANQRMIDGPNDATVPAGANIATHARNS